MTITKGSHFCQTNTTLNFVQEVNEIWYLERAVTVHSGGMNHIFLLNVSSF